MTPGGIHPESQREPGSVRARIFSHSHNQARVVASIATRGRGSWNYAGYAAVYWPRETFLNRSLLISV